MKYSQQGLTASQIASIRIFSGGIVFLPFAIFHIGKIPRRKMGLVILSAIFGNLLPAFLFATAISKIDSLLAGIMNSLTPICVVVIGILFFRDRIKPQKIAGVLVGFSGLLLLTFLPVLIEHKSIGLYNLDYSLLIVLGTLVYGMNVNIVSHGLQGLNPIHLATVSLSFMVIPTSIVLWQKGFLDLDLSDSTIRWSVLASALLGVVGSAIATALFYILVQKAGGLFASLVTYGIPFVALLWGFVYGEKITLLEVLCLAIILLGVYLAKGRIEKKAVK